MSRILKEGENGAELQEQRKKLSSLVASKLEEYLKFAGQKMGEELTLEALFYYRAPDYRDPDGTGVYRGEYNKGKSYGREVVYPVVSTKEGWFVLGGTSLEPGRITPGEEGSECFRIDRQWSQNRGIGSYDYSDMERAWSLGYHWWSVDGRIFLKDGDNDTLLPAVSRLAPGSSIQERLLESRALSPLFNREVATQALLTVLGRATQKKIG